MRTEIQSKRDAEKFVLREKRKDGTLRVALKCPKGTRVKQEFKKECDVNNIVAKFGMRRIRQHAETFGARYGFASQDQYQHSLMVIREAESQFQELPAKIRAEFGGDPGKYLEFMEDEGNRTRAQELGIFFPDVEAAEAAEDSAESAGESPSGDVDDEPGGES